MQITIEQAGLARALRLIARAVPARPQLPILQHVLMDVGGGRLTMTATDLDIGVVTSLPIGNFDETRVAVPARLLGEYVAQLPAEAVQLQLDAAKHRLRASCGRFVASFPTVAPDDFPALPPVDGGETVDLDGRRLRSAIERVAFAAAHDEQRPVLSGVLFDFGDDGLTLAAADGFRLARARLPEVHVAARQVLVPARAVAELGRLLGEAEAARLVILADGRGVRLEVGDTAIFARLIEGRFPDVEQVIPRDAGTRVTVDAEEMRHAVRVAGLFGASGDARPVVLDATASRLRLHARGDQTGEAEGELAATLDGAEQAVALNTRLFAEIVEAATGPRLELAWTAPHTPVVVREAQPSDAADLWIVMPLHDPSLTARQAAAAPAAADEPAAA